MRTSVQAFQLGLVCFLIPFGFAFEPGLLGQGELTTVLASSLSVLAGTAGWAVALVGYCLRPLRLAERGLFAVGGGATICLPTGSQLWVWALAALVASGVWIILTRERNHSGTR